MQMELAGSQQGEGMTPVTHSLWFPIRESPFGSLIPHTRKGIGYLSRQHWNFGAFCQGMLGL